MRQAFLSLASKQPIIFSYPIRSDEGLTLETSAFQLVTVANLHFQPSWYNQITLLPPPTQHRSFFINFHQEPWAPDFHPLFYCLDWLGSIGNNKPGYNGWYRHLL